MNELTRPRETSSREGVAASTILARAEALCRDVAGRDLGGTPLYIVPQSAIEWEFGNAEGCDGYTTPSLDLYLRDHIGPAWRGRGPCMVINDVVLTAELHPDDVEYVVLAAALHELAHILVRPALYVKRDCVGPDRLLFETLVVADAVKRDGPANRPAYFGHEAPFIRTALHLRHRAEVCGVRIAPALLCAGYGYGLSHAERYAIALGDEPERMTGALLRDILAADPPAAFSRLWKQDLSVYHQRFPIQQGASA
jgi:hypothetical protein